MNLKRNEPKSINQLENASKKTILKRNESNKPLKDFWKVK